VVLGEETQIDREEIVGVARQISRGEIRETIETVEKQVPQKETVPLAVLLPHVAPKSPLRPLSLPHHLAVLPVLTSKPHGRPVSLR